MRSGGVSAHSQIRPLRQCAKSCACEPLFSRAGEQKKEILQEVFFLCPRPSPCVATCPSIQTLALSFSRHQRATQQYVRFCYVILPRCSSCHFAALLKLPLRVTMDARTTACVRAVNLVVRQANDAAVTENMRLRCAVERARLAIEQGDRPLAMRLLANALNQEPAPAASRGHNCAMCGVRKRTVVQMNATGQWSMVPPTQRRLCGQCCRMQPP